MLASVHVWAAPQTRVALVIGNGGYEHAPRLSNPVHDATDIAAALGALGYSVQLVKDARKAGMEAALAQFAKVAKGADQALVYYSGHGIEVGGVNYLLPVEARAESETTIPLEAVALPTVMGVAAGARQLGLVVLDACRNNPLANSMQRVDGSRGVARGLAPVEPAGNVLVAYATRDGRVAADGTGRNSPYTAAILETLREPGLEVGLFWRTVRDRVLSATQAQQEPFTYGSLGAERLYLNPPAASPTPSPSPASVYDPRAAELALWQGAQRLGTQDAYRDYLTKYPQGQFSTQAKLQLAALGRPAASGAGLVSPSTGASGTTTPAGLRDCAECPEMVAIPPGSFKMGSPSTEENRQGWEGPVHQVHIRYAFSVSKYPITYREWEQFVKESGHKDPSRECIVITQQDANPVVCVHPPDAEDYAAWLSRKSGQHYRLLTEAEYEYVTRAGSQTAYPWGEAADGMALYTKERRGGLDGPWRVGSFKPNAFGLYDTVGLVWSFTQDCQHMQLNYIGAPTDGSVWKGGDCYRRMVRGGSWQGNPSFLRSATRGFDSIGSYEVGFRLARTP